MVTFAYGQPTTSGRPPSASRRAPPQRPESSGTPFLDEEVVDEIPEQHHDQADEHDHDGRSRDVGKHRREHPAPSQRCGLKHDMCGSASPRRALWLAVGLPQHPDQHRPKAPVPHAIDQKLERLEASASRIATHK